jgi:hypothetical protein
MKTRHLLAALASATALSIAPAWQADAKAPAGRFTVKTDASGDVVDDALMQRTWQRATASDTYTWANAKTYCAGLALQGGGWRLTDLRELRSLVDFKEPAPTIDKTAFPNTHNEHYWSGTPFQPSPSSHARNTGFDYGDSDGHVISNNYRVRCVR